MAMVRGGQREEGWFLSGNKSNNTSRRRTPFKTTPSELCWIFFGGKENPSGLLLSASFIVMKTFIETTFCSRVDYAAWVAAGADDAELTAVVDDIGIVQDSVLGTLLGRWKSLCNRESAREH